MKKIFTLRAFFVLLLLLSGFVQGQTITAVSINSPAPYCLGNIIRIRVNYSGFGLAGSEKQFTVEASDNAGNFPSSELFDATTLTGTNANQLTTANNGVGSITLKRTAAFSSNYKIKVTSVSPNPGVSLQSAIFSVNSNAPIGTASDNNICSGGTFALNLMADLQGTTFSWPSITASGILESPIAASSGSPTSISQVLTATATAQTNAAPSVTYKVIPTAPDGCVGASFDVKASVFKIINPGSFPSTAKTICSGAISEAIPTPTLTALVGSRVNQATYEWYHNGDLISGQNAETFTETDVAVLVNSTNAAITHTYTRKVFLGNGVCEGTTDNSYALTVMPAITAIIALPTPSTFCASNNTITPGGNSGVITETSSTGINISYQWESSTNGTTGFNPIGGETGSTYDPPALNASLWYRRKSTSSSPVCSAYSNTVKITINIPTAGAIASDQEFCKIANGSDPIPVAFTSTTPGAAAAGGDLTYQWKRNTVTTLASYTDIESATGETYTPPANAGTDLYYYRRFATSTLEGVSCTAATADVYVSVNTVDPKTIGGGSATICSGQTPAAFTSIAAATRTSGTLTYQWQSSTTSGSGYTDIDGATGLTYTPTAALTTTTYYVRKAIATNTVNSSYATCSALSNEITVTVNAIPTAAATNKSICSGSGTALEVRNPNNILGASFTWVASYGAVTGGNGSGSGSFGPNAITETLFNATGAPIVVTYTIIPQGPAPTNCPGTSITVDVTVNPLPTAAVLSLVSASPICEGDLEMKVDVTGGTGLYTVVTALMNVGQFSPTGEVTTSNYASGATITRSGLLASPTINNYILLSVRDANGCAVPIGGLSSTAKVKVNRAATNVQITADPVGAICQGATVDYGASWGTQEGTPSFSWKDGMGATLSTQGLFSHVWSEAPGAKSVQLTISVEGCAPALSNVISFNLNAQPSGAIITGVPSTSVCEGTVLNLTSTAIVGGTAPTYSWSKSTDGGFNYSNSLGSESTLSEAAVFSNTGLRYKLDVTFPAGSGCTALSNSTSVGVSQTPVATATAVAPTICSGQAAQVNVVNTIPVVGATIKWTAVYNGVMGSSAGSGTDIAFGPMAISEILTGDGTAVYTITPVGPTGTLCEGEAKTVTITVTAPVTPTFDAIAAVCKDASAPTLPTTSKNGITGTWSPEVSTAAVGSTMYIFMPTAGQCATTATMSITVNDLPAKPTITPFGPTTFCQGGTVTLSAPVADSYLWSNSSIMQSIPVTASGTFTVKVKVGLCESLSSDPVTVTVNSLPAVPTIIEGGPTTFCQGGSVTLSAPLSAGYLWSNGAITQSINVTESGNFTLTITNANGCQSQHPSTPVTVTVNPLPITPTITPGGPTTFCQGGSVNLSAPVSTSYLWSNNATDRTINVSATGTFTVKVKDANGCESLPSAPITVTVNPLPAKPTITASGATAFCTGGSVMLTSSAASGYTWNPGGATTQSITVNSSGTYTVSVSDANQCVAVSDGIEVTINPLPIVFNVSGGGISFCSAPLAISLDGSQTGVNYQLKRGNTLVSTVVGTGGSFSFPTVTQAGTYTVVAVAVAGGCSLPMSGSAVVSVASAPALFTVSGGGISCGGELKGIRLSDSQVGVSYQLKRGSTVIDVRAGTGAAIDFDAQSAAGNYTVVALSPCNDRVMNGSATITAVAFPAVFSVTGGGTACGSSAVPVGLSGSQSGVSYQLYRGSTPVGTTIQGNGSALSLGSHNITGEYAVKAKNSAGCEMWMYSSAIVISLPSPTVFTVTGGGPACGAGAVISLSGSQGSGSELEYQLKRGNTVVQTIPATGGALWFDPQTVAGTYTVVAIGIKTGACPTPMSGSVSVTSTGALPLTYNVTVTNNGRYCNNTPVGIGLSDTQSGKYYQLQRKNASNVFVNVGTAISGNGSAISLGSHSTLGTYQVVVSSVCGNIPMNNTVEIIACNPAARIAAEDLDAAPQPWAAIAPNPVVSGRASLLIRNQANQTVTWQMMDLQGRTVSNGSFEALTNAHQEDLNVRDVKVGNYLLNVQAGTKKMNLKVMKIE